MKFSHKNERENDVRRCKRPAVKNSFVSCRMFFTFLRLREIVSSLKRFHFVLSERAIFAQTHRRRKDAYKCQIYLKQLVILNV